MALFGCGGLLIVFTTFGLLCVFKVVRTFYIPSKTMAPTLQPGDMILVSGLPYLYQQPKRGEIVVFIYPDKDKSRPKVDYIKRIIGLPGETVEIRDGSVLINGTALSEPYVSELAYADFGKKTIPSGQYFVLGDNRNHSSDSRVWGLLDRTNIEGKMLIRWWRSPP